MWTETNPRQYFKTTLHPLNLTVCVECTPTALLDRGSFEMSILYTKMKDLQVMLGKLWFQQDDATAKETLILFISPFFEKSFSSNAIVNWPWWSCQFLPAEYFLWGFLPFKVYANKPTTLESLEFYIRWAINEIRRLILEMATRN